MSARRLPRGVRRLAWGLLGVLAVLVLATVVVATRGRVESFGPALLGRPGGVPPWTRPCWVRRPRAGGRPFTLECWRATGMVLWRQYHDPDGDGDQHLLVLAGAHLVNVKLPLPDRQRQLPGIGSQITVVGRVGGRSHVLATEILAHGLS